MARKHKVKPGDCLASIARLYGFVDWKVIWESDGNKELRKKRKNPDILAPGDEVDIPDKKPANLKLKPGESAKLSLKNAPIKLRLKVADNHGMKCKAERYVLRVDGLKDPFEDELKESGEIDLDIPAVARRATLEVYAKGIEEPIQHFVLSLGQVDPIDTIAGVQARLEAIGYDCGGVDGILGPLTRAAICAFQRTHGQEPTGDPEDEPFQKKLASWTTELEKGTEWPKTELKLDPKPTGGASSTEEDEPKQEGQEAVFYLRRQDDGAPAAGAIAVIELADGSTIEKVADSQGVVRVPGSPGEHLKLVQVIDPRTQQGLTGFK